ncbi:outer membrane beta-barrel protein [Roseateles cavernae]|uniref:outer membrane beta-barrel protein n=1 Tax=Roseateles cavernae TaxID=3153578 RepID=UPI0032E3EE99
MKNIIALALVATLSTAAQAEGFYIGADVGQTRISEQGAKFKDTGLNLYGGYQFSENIAAEAGYRTLGKDTVSVFNVPVTVKGSALQLSAVLSAPLGTDFSVFGRVGVNRIEVKASAQGQRDKDSETKALFGFGARYAVSKQVGLRAEFQKPASDVKVFSAGIDFRF